MTSLPKKLSGVLIFLFLLSGCNVPSFPRLPSDAPVDGNASRMMLCSETPYETELTSYEQDYWLAAEGDGWQLNTANAYNKWYANSINFDKEMFIRLSQPNSDIKDEFFSGQYQTKCGYLYGKFEARFLAPMEEGLVTSFFLYSDDTKDEIDVEILGWNKPGENIQFNFFKNGNKNDHNVCYPDGSYDMSVPHTYGIAWGEDFIRWQIDGNWITKCNKTGSQINLPSSPMLMIVNLWAGNDSKWPGVFAGGTEPIAKYEWISYKPVQQPSPTGCNAQNTSGFSAIGKVADLGLLPSNLSYIRQNEPDIVILENLTVNHVNKTYYPEPIKYVGIRGYFSATDLPEPGTVLEVNGYLKNVTEFSDGSTMVYFWVSAAECPDGSVSIISP